MFASCSKDNSLMVWSISAAKSEVSVGEYDKNLVKNIAIATGHTNSLTSVRFSHLGAKSFILSASEDTTLKLWPLGDLLAGYSGDIKLVGSK